MTQKHLRSCVDLADRAKSLGSEELFVETYPFPFLVVLPAELWETTGYRTIDRSSGRASDVVRTAPLTKRTGSNAFSSMITIGRTENNDVILKAPGVSKFHAFVSAMGSSYTLTDGGSTFGTWVNSVRLESRVASDPLRCGDEIRLGESVRLTFYTSAGLYKALGSLAP